MKRRLIILVVLAALLIPSSAFAQSDSSTGTSYDHSYLQEYDTYVEGPSETNNFGTEFTFRFKKGARNASGTYLRVYLESLDKSHIELIIYDPNDKVIVRKNTGSYSNNQFLYEFRPRVDGIYTFKIIPKYGGEHKIKSAARAF